MQNKRVVMWAGVLLGAAAGLIVWASGLGPKAAWTAAVTGLCAGWWLTEAVPIGATSLVPLFVLPLAGVMDAKAAAAAYGDDVVLLFLGGFMLSVAVEQSGVHRRWALGILRVIGAGSGRRLVLGFLLASTLVSMWISNTATALMLLPVATAVIGMCEDPAVAAPLLLAVAYGASIGGLGTPIGSPPNGIFIATYQRVTGVQMGFLEWMGIGVPVAVLMTPIAAMWLGRGLGKRAVVRLPEPEPWTKAEVRVLVIFAITAAAWVTRTQPLGGWSQFIGGKGVTDATVALAGAVALFMVGDGKGGRLLEWGAAERIPWSVLILFGGGIAISQGFESSGLSAALGRQMAQLTALPPVAMIAGVAAASTMGSEIASNTALASLLMPVMAAAAHAAKIEPALLMVPATIGASTAFMLPVSTPPNAIAYATGRVPMRRMATDGLVLNIASVGVATVVCYFKLCTAK